MNICPVTGNVCNKPPTFLITEQLGDKGQSTKCCRDCASLHIQQRNTLIESKELQSSQSQVMPLKDFVATVFGYAAKPQVSKGVKSCEKCGWTFDDVLRNRTIGCGNCYVVFAEELKPYIDESQKATKHVGKVPLAAKLAGLPVEEQIAVLESSMQVAIEKEDYDKAAKFRDMIKAIKGNSPPSD